MLRKYEMKLRKLEEEIKDNLFDMEMIIELIFDYEEMGKSTSILERMFNNLQESTHKLKEEYYQLLDEHREHNILN